MLSNLAGNVESLFHKYGDVFTLGAWRMFMEVWSSPALGFDYPNARVRIYGDGQKPITWVSYKDAGELAIRSLQAPDARNRKLLIGGPENLSPRAVVRTFEEVSGRTYEIETIPEAALLA